MHFALSLPEIVATILRSTEDSASFLHTCLFINRLFYIEASRILWNRCGSGYHVYRARCPPRIRHLVELLEQDPERAQFYVQFIQKLSFMTDNSTEDRNKQDEAQWHNSLRSLTFSRLQTFSVYHHSPTEAFNHPDNILPYINPNLRELFIPFANIQSESFFKVLVTNAPQLQALSFLDCKKSHPDEFSNTSFACYMKALSSLRTLFIGQLGCAWSCATLEALADHPMLQSIAMPAVINNDWISGIKDTLGFPSLDELVTTVNDSTFPALLPYIKGITRLTLDQVHQAPQHSLLGCASNLAQLVHLSITFPANTPISAHDLIGVANGCPKLHTLVLPPDSYFNPSLKSNNISDDTIVEMAKLLKGLRCFSLFIEPISLTNNSIVALYNNCMHLDRCSISADVNFSTLVTEGRLPTSQNLSGIKALTLRLPTENRPQIPKEHIEEITSGLKTNFPSINLLNIHGGAGIDRQVAGLFHSLC